MTRKHRAQVERRNKLIQVLRNLKKKQFYMESFFCDNGEEVWPTYDEIRVARKLRKDPECGSAACVGGWATVLFPRHASKVGGVIEYEMDMANLVGISTDDAHKLMFDGMHMTAKQKAKQLERMGKDYDKASEHG